MKKHNKDLNIHNRNLYFLATVLLCLFLMLLIASFKGTLASSESKNDNIEKEIIYKNKNPINLNEILNQNSSENIREEMVIEEMDMEYTTRYKNTDKLQTGVMQVLKEGRVGKKNAVIIKKYNNDELVSEEQVAENIVKAPDERVVEVGISDKYNVYEAQVGDEVYVVSESVSVKVSPNVNSEKICTLNKNDVAKILNIEEDWYFISTIEIKGYVPKYCVTTENAMQEKVSEKPNNVQQAKQQLVSNLSFSMDLRVPSNFSLDQFKEILSNDVNDKNGIFANNAEYFYYAEEQYGINGVFLASVGIHESGWGTSTIAKNKNNLFGYGAVDSNPYGGAKQFTSYAECIDLLARVFVKYYLNPPGTLIYDNTPASGKFYAGSDLTSVNNKYASDKNWANSVYKWMEYLYNKL